MFQQTYRSLFKYVAQTCNVKSILPNWLAGNENRFLIRIKRAGEKGVYGL
jgi:hypothetical protein